MSSPTTPAFMNWSGGKDSSLCLYHVLKKNVHAVKYLLTTLSKQHLRISMHGVRQQLLFQQAEALGLPLQTIYLPEQASMEQYNQLMHDQMQRFRSEGICTAIFGDIFLEDLKLYREAQLAKLGLQGVFPLWKRDSTELYQEFIALGFKAITVCVNGKKLDRSFVGRLLDAQFLQDLPPNVDPCGENGEFHTFVYDGPLFKTPIRFRKGEVIERTYTPALQQADNCHQTRADLTWDNLFYFCDLLVD